MLIDQSVRGVDHDRHVAWRIFGVIGYGRLTHCDDYLRKSELKNNQKYDHYASPAGEKC